MALCPTFSNLTFMSSCGRTSGTKSAPTVSHAGRAPSTKSSSMTQCLYGSHITGHASVMSAFSFSETISSFDVAGVILSTIVDGYLASVSSHCCVAGSKSKSAAAPSTRRFATSPLCGRLSQDIIVNGLRPCRLRLASAASRMPKTVAPAHSAGVASSLCAPSTAPSSASFTSVRSPSLIGTRYPNSVIVRDTIFTSGEDSRRTAAAGFSNDRSISRSVTT
mmetsp:Transcript_5222/g.17454  ORF Transcript_5222/g.17454 Transcript_5222/m.17454 type:complete len:221 (+) Transcript_5222:1052-1714(+)